MRSFQLTNSDIDHFSYLIYYKLLQENRGFAQENNCSNNHIHAICNEFTGYQIQIKVFQNR
jgi:hypothetical protein